MLGNRVGRLLKDARRGRNLTRDELARRAGVSTRLVAELERGQRPNVSLESALKLLKLAGVSVVMESDVERVSVIERSDSRSAMLARAALRRKTWTGRRIHLHDQDPDSSVKSKAKRVAATAHISEQGYEISSRHGRSKG